MMIEELFGRAVRFFTASHTMKMEPVRGIEPKDICTKLPDQFGIYVHVPFCERICKFCPYNKVRYQPALAKRYINALRSEWALLEESLKSREVKSMYIGGGSPTLLPELLEELCGVAEELGIAGEVGVEVIPSHATPELLKRIRAMGINFISLGIQSFDDEVLQYLGRSHDAEAGRRALAAAVDVGFDCIDVDLVFDVVKFGPDGVIKDSKIAFEMGADQVSAYPMMRFSYTPIGTHKTHNERLEKQTLDTINDVGEKLGYSRTSVWTFNKNPQRRYTSITREYYLGLGPSGSSFLKDFFAINTFDIQAYIDLVERGKLPVVFQMNMSPKESMAYYIFWRLYEGCIGRSRFQKLSGISIERQFPGLLLFFYLLGGMKRSGDSYVLTRTGLNIFHTVERWVTYNLIEPTWAACRSTPYPKTLYL